MNNTVNIYTVLPDLFQDRAQHAHKNPMEEPESQETLALYDEFEDSQDRFNLCSQSSFLNSQNSLRATTLELKRVSSHLRSQDLRSEVFSQESEGIHITSSQEDYFKHKGVLKGTGRLHVTKTSCIKLAGSAKSSSVRSDRRSKNKKNVPGLRISGDQLQYKLFVSETMFENPEDWNRLVSIMNAKGRSPSSRDQEFYIAKRSNKKGNALGTLLGHAFEKYGLHLNGLKWVVD